MTRFNTSVKRIPTAPDTINKAGGEAYSQSADLELASILLTSFGGDSFYRSADDTFARVKELIAKCDKLFVAKAAVYARREFGMRSITHVVAAELAKYIGGLDWAKDFYARIVYRPDDMSEIMSYYFANCAKKSSKSKRGRKTIPNAMKAGFAKAFEGISAYGFAKYRGAGNGIKLVDVVNIVHPVPSEANGYVPVNSKEYANAISEAKRKVLGKEVNTVKEIPALEALTLGLLKPAETWETKLTQAGQNAESEDEKADLKKDAWVSLITEKKIKYLALLRNLRNIIEQAPEVVDAACDMLTDKEAVKNSLVFPFQYMSAYEQVEMLNSSVARKVLKALNVAIDISCSNVPKFDGETLVVLDVSSSMTSCMSDKTKMTVAKIGALFAAVLVKSNDADFMTFDGTARYKNLNSQDSTMTVAGSIKFTGGSTNFDSIFEAANKKYDRIVILSDMQGWVGYHVPKNSFNRYKTATKANPYIYSFDLQNYGTMQFAESKVLALAGFSDKVFDIMKMVEQDPKAFVNAINDYSLTPAVKAPVKGTNGVVKKVKVVKSASAKTKVKKATVK